MYNSVDMSVLNVYKPTKALFCLFPLFSAADIVLKRCRCFIILSFCWFIGNEAGTLKLTFPMRINSACCASLMQPTNNDLTETCLIRTSGGDSNKYLSSLPTFLYLPSPLLVKIIYWPFEKPLCDFPSQALSLPEIASESQQYLLFILHSQCHQQL